MSRRMSRVFAPALALAAVLLLVLPVAAHANLVRSSPPAGAQLEVAPPSIELEFSEDLDGGFSRVQLFDSRNQLVEPGPGQVDAGNPRLLRLIIPDLARGSYTAIWRVRSAVDGHISAGSLPFGVSEPPAAGSLIPPPGAPDPATLAPPPLDTAVRWLNYLAAVLALGAAPFGLLVWRPAYRRWAPTAPQAAPAADAAIAGVLRRLTIAGGCAFVLTNLLLLLTQAANAADVPLAQALGAPLVLLLSGRTGWLWLARLALLALLIGLAGRLPPPGGAASRLWWALLVIAGAVLLSLSMLSHAAADAQAAFALPLDWFHLAAMVLWVGGFMPLLAAVGAARRAPEQAMPLALLIPRFTRVALPSVLVLVLTGAYQYVLHVGRIDLLGATTYGRALVAKLALFVVLVLLGALNMLVLARRLRGDSQAPARAFGRSVSTEVTIAALVLLLAGVLTSVAPSVSAWQAHEQQGIAQSASLGDVGLTLRIAPAQIGDNEFAVDVADRRPGAAAAATKVLLRFDMLGMQMNKLQAEAAASGGERYTVRGNFTTMGGRWHIEVVLRRAGFDDVRHTFEVDILRGAPFVIEP
ncbi:MAG: CopD family protein [Kouleothrix sp.]|nr:CopD family protein [Kouleothrix sp.]